LIITILGENIVPKEDAKTTKVYGIFTLLGCYEAHIGSYLLLPTTNCVTPRRAKISFASRWKPAKKQRFTSQVPAIGIDNMDARLYEMTGIVITLAYPDVIYDNRL
jgi:hypothetical protein